MTRNHSTESKYLLSSSSKGQHSFILQDDMDISQLKNNEIADVKNYLNSEIAKYSKLVEKI